MGFRCDLFIIKKSERKHAFIGPPLVTLADIPVSLG